METRTDGHRWRRCLDVASFQSTVFLENGLPASRIVHWNRCTVIGCEMH
jgi:hypothetical protein